MILAERSMMNIWNHSRVYLGTTEMQGKTIMLIFMMRKKQVTIVQHLTNYLL